MLENFKMNIEYFNDKIKVERKAGIEPPRKFEDYDISVDTSMPSGVELIEKI